MAYYFTKNNINLPNIDRNRFLEASLVLKSKLNESNLNQLFDLIDINASGSISPSEFFLLFDEPDQQIEKQKANVRLPEELQKEIKMLFEEVDVDNSKFIDKNELSQALMKVGINPTLQELDEYILKFDKDGDGKISYAEFLYIFQDKLKNEMLMMDEMISKLRKEFKKADIYQNRLLNKEQLRFKFIIC